MRSCCLGVLFCVYVDDNEVRELATAFAMAALDKSLSMV